MARQKNAAPEITLDEGTAATVDANEATTPDEGTNNGGTTSWPGGYAEYKLAGSIAPQLVGKTIRTREAKGDGETRLAQMRLLVKDGDAGHVAKLAQNQYDIIVQRRIRDVADSEEVKAILAGKSEVEINGEKLDFSGMDEEARVQYCVDLCQDEADAYQYGATTRSGTTRLPKAAKQAVENQAKLAQAAAADPDLAAKLAALGLTL